MITVEGFRRYFSYDDDILRRVMRLVFFALPVLLLLGRSLMDIGLSAIAISFLIYSAYWRDFNWLKSRWVQAAMIFWLYMLANSLVAYDVTYALKSSIVFGRFPLFAVAVSYWVVRELRDIEIFIMVFVAAAVFAISDSLFEYVMGYDFMGDPKDVGRLSGPFDKSTVGIYLTKTGLPMILGLSWLLFSRRGMAVAGSAKYVILLFSLALIATITLSGERMAVVLMLFFLVLAFWQLPGYRKELFTLGLVALLAVGATVAADPSMRNRLVGQTLNDLKVERGNAFGYKEIILLSLEMIKDEPLIGVGPDNYRRICEDEKYLAHLNGRDGCLIHPHNVVLEILVNNGLIGLLLFAAMVFYWFQMIFRTKLPDEHRLLMMSGALAAVLFLWPFSVGMSIFSNFNGSVFWIMMAYMLASYQLIAKRPYGEVTQYPPSGKSGLVLADA